MKAYLIITGTIFALMAGMHLVKAISERSQLNTQPAYFLSMVGLGLLSAALAVWALALLRPRSRT